MPSTSQVITQAIVTKPVKGEFNPHRKVERFALFHENGVPVEFSSDDSGSSTKAAAMEDSSAETVEELVNDFNLLLANLRAAGIIDT